MVKDNNFLGKFVLSGLPKTLRGVHKIKVTFNIDSNGILDVTAEDAKTQSKSEVQITNEKGRLTNAQIERMLEEAETNKDSDSLAKGEIMSRESLKTYMRRTRTALEDIDASKIEHKDRERVEARLDDAEFWLEQAGSTATVDEICAKQRNLEIAFNTIMLKINSNLPDFWDDAAQLPEGEATIENGGFFLESGFDLRELFEDPD